MERELAKLGDAVERVFFGVSRSGSGGPCINTAEGAYRPSRRPDYGCATEAARNNAAAFSTPSVIWIITLMIVAEHGC